jgi:hypothetical protein
MGILRKPGGRKFNEQQIANQFQFGLDEQH